MFVEKETRVQIMKKKENNDFINKCFVFNTIENKKGCQYREVLYQVLSRKGIVILFYFVFFPFYQCIIMI